MVTNRNARFPNQSIELTIEQ